jgi:hypothetical protein
VLDFHSLVTADLIYLKRSLNSSANQQFELRRSLTHSQSYAQNEKHMPMCTFMSNNAHVYCTNGQNREEEEEERDSVVGHIHAYFLMISKGRL